MKLAKIIEKIIGNSRNQEREVKKLQEEEMKRVAVPYNGPFCCWWQSLSDNGCTDDPNVAEQKGTYTWFCNTPEAKEKCNC